MTCRKLPQCKLDEGHSGPCTNFEIVAPAQYPRCYLCGCHIVFLQQTSNRADECAECYRLNMYRFEAGKLLERLEKALATIPKTAGLDADTIYALTKGR